MVKSDEPSDAKVHGQPKRSTARTRLQAALIFSLLLAAYLANGDILPGADTVGSVRVAGKAVAKRKLVFTPDEDPFMFTWRLHTPTGESLVRFRSWDAMLNDQPVLRARQRGDLTVEKPGYFLMKTPRPDVYGSRYGVGAGLFAVPFVAAVYPFARDLYEQSSADILWFTTKVAASCAVAATAVLLFLAALPFLRVGTAAGLALTYGLGTCAWSTDSQALWQHGPAGFFLALGTTLLLRSEDRRRATWVGLSYAAAFACRPTAATVLVAVGIYYLLRDRRALVRFVIGALPVVLLLAAYNLHTFGRVMVLGQMNIGEGAPTGTRASLFDIVPMAHAATGSAFSVDRRYFGTAFLEGIAGIFVSPSRGLLVFSPVLLVALWGVVRAFRNHRFAVLRPLVAASATTCLFVAGWFSWWGGWSYGPRLLSDVLVLLAFLAIPVAEEIRSRRGLSLIFGACLAWSVSVQFVGAFAYDVVSWNVRRVFAVKTSDARLVRLFVDRSEAEQAAWALRGSVEERTSDVDTLQGHSRLWSIRDSQILYYVTHFSESREFKKLAIEQFLRSKG